MNNISHDGINNALPDGAPLDVSGATIGLETRAQYEMVVQAAMGKN